MRTGVTCRGRAARAVAAVLVTLAFGVAGCGGDDGESVSIEDVSASLEEAGYTVADTGGGSKFTKVQPAASRLVQGNDIPAGGFVVIEAFETAEDAERVRGEYESIDTPVVVEESLVYSTSEPADQGDLDAVAEAAGS